MAMIFMTCSSRLEAECHSGLARSCDDLADASRHYSRILSKSKLFPAASGNLHSIGGSSQGRLVLVYRSRRYRKLKSSAIDLVVQFRSDSLASAWDGPKNSWKGE
jgi:hypothetical protein